MKRILILFGTRPEAIKLAPLVRALQARPDADCRICLTAQHREMLDQVLDFFALQSDYDLDLMTPGQSLAALSARILTRLEPVLADFQPDILIVQGDTTTSMIGGLLTFYHRIPLCHIEAGLRTGDKSAPFPEEINRRITTVLADLHIAPTERNRQALLREHVPAEHIHVTGNTVIDALLLAREQVRKQPPPGIQPLLHSLGDRHIVLITGHRRESFGEGFEHICQAIAETAARFPDTAFVYPVHLNPNVQEPVHRLLGPLPNLHLIPPLAYPEFVALMDRAHLILTDSGGVQEEAPSLGKPVLVMRDTTEREEGITAGTARLVGTQRHSIAAALNELLTDPRAYAAMANAHNPYGDGHATERIVTLLLN